MSEKAQLIYYKSLTDSVIGGNFADVAAHFRARVRGVVGGDASEQQFYGIARVNSSLLAARFGVELPESYGLKIGDKEYRISGTRKIASVNGDQVFRAQVEDVPGAEIVMVATRGGIVASVQEVPFTASEAVSSAVIFPKDPSSTSDEHVVMRLPRAVDECVTEQYTEMVRRAESAATLPFTIMTGESSRDVADYAVLYTPDALRASNGTMDSLIAANHVMNVAALKSAYAHATVHLEHQGFVEGIPDGQDSATIFNAVANHAGVAQLMEQMRLDFVQVVVNRFADNVGGRGHMNGPLSIVSLAGYRDKSGRHELIGHNFGFAHDVANDAGLPQAIKEMLAANPGLQHDTVRLGAILRSAGLLGLPVWGHIDTVNSTVSINGYSGGRYVRVDRLPNVSQGFGSEIADGPTVLNATFAPAAARREPTNADPRETPPQVPPRRTRVFLPIVVR